MRYRLIVATAFLIVSMHAGAVVIGSGQALPVKEGRAVAASVNGESVFVDEVAAQLDPAADRSHLLLGRGTKQDFEILDRLVNVRLVVQEAATMGLDDLPEIRKEVEVSSRAILREALMMKLVRNVQPDPSAVEKVFKELVKEWKTASLLFEDEALAGRARDEIAKGKSFSEVSAAAVAAKSARADSDDAYHGRKEYLPQIAEAVDRLTVGQVSPVVRIPAGFVVLTVTDIRYPETAEARAEARKRVVTQKQQELLEAHEQELRRKHVVVNQAVLDGLDFAAAKPGIDALLKDQRVVAEIKGADNVTVGDLADYLRMQFFHGGDQAGQGKRMNARKEAALDATLARRLLNMEALRLGIDKTPAYLDRVRAYRDSLVFDRFVQKVIVPDSKMREEEVRKEYDAHLKDYSYPEMMRLRSLVFAERRSAEEAIRRARAGADYGWLVANAEGQVDKEQQLLKISDGQPLTTDSMPAGMQKALAGSREGDVRLYASPEGQFYVLIVREVIEPTAKPYAEVREEIAKKLYGEKLKEHMDDYIGKLKALSKVEVYLKNKP